MDAGQLDRRITLQRQAVATDDGFTTLPGDFEELAVVWARFIPLTGAERAQASQTQAFGKANWEIRKDTLWADLNANDRIVDSDGRVFNILNVTFPRREWMFVESIAPSDS